MAHTSVKITSNSSDYQASMKSCAQATKVLAAEYGTAATRAKEFGTVTDQLKVKAEGLTEKIKVQKQIVDLNAGQQEKLTQKLSSQKTEQEALKKKSTTQRVHMRNQQRKLARIRSSQRP